ncbi:MAG: DUF4922 domain-containing protein [Phormidesmis sp.]
MSDRIPWQAGNLWPRLKAQRQHGLRMGALQPAETVVEYVESGGVRFVVRVLTNLSQKEAAGQKARQFQAETASGKTVSGKTAPVNPFLPYEKDLYVTDISETHLCLLNKFNVVDHHFLIVTRQYEPQENWLTLTDFEALVRCLQEVDGVAFFNGGTVAGSSQPHKHLQVVPYTSEPDTRSMEAAITAAQLKSGSEGVRESPVFPFMHVITLTGSEAIAQQQLDRYHTLLNAVGIVSDQWQGLQTAAYNLLCTREWMMIVPRRQEKYANISVNSLGFVGSLLVKDEAMLEQLREIGPMTLLKQVGFSR